MTAHSDRITELEAELSAVAAHSLTQCKKLRAQSQQLERVQEALTSLTSEVRSTSYRPRYDEGMDHVIDTIREALGDTRE